MNHKIRVAHFVGSMNLGGAETFIMNIYRKIDREKIQFDFVCSKKDVAFYDAEIKELGGRIFYIDEPKKIGLYKSFKQIKKILENREFDVVHSHISLFSGIVLMAANYAKIPIRIAHSHSAVLDKIGILRNVYTKLMKTLINIYATKKLSCGELAAKYLYGKSKDIIILNNCIDLEKYNNISLTDSIKLKKSLNISDNTFIIGHVGRFSKVKNHMFIIEIAKRIKQEKRNFKILLVGDGELREQVQEDIISNNLQDNIQVLGIRKDIPEMMNIFDVLLLPSLFEGFPIVILEAQAANLPCIVSDTISNEIELGFGLVEFASLNNVDTWIDKILAHKNNKLKNENIVVDMSKLGYDIVYNVEKLYDIYSIN
jgi:glycosyltransferase EpsF